MISYNEAVTTEVMILTWTIVLATVISSAGYLWHRLKEAFPEFFRLKPKSKRYLEDAE
jgi:hypothetical protein